MIEIDEQKILQLLRDAGQPLSTIDLTDALNLRSSDRRDLREVLRLMESQRLISSVKGKYWRLGPPPKSRQRGKTGILQVTSKGYGFVRLDEESVPEGKQYSDVLVREDDLGSALDGDEVRVEIEQTGDRGPSGRIVEVLKRNRSQVVGIYQRTGDRRGEVIPRDNSLNRRVSVAIPDEKLGVQNFEWVVARITDYPEGPAPLKGEVVERLGASHERGIDVLVLLRDQGIVPEFSQAVEQFAAKLDDDLQHEIPRRRDLRQMLTVTIDPATAKDFDDAISIEPLGEGKGWRLWVHIADVAHFVRNDDPIDREARDRSTSVYPVDRVVPMLPERLSNHLCSLRPNEDKLTMTAEMVINPQGEIEDAEIYSSAIHSRRRFAYEEVQRIYDSPAGHGVEVTPEVQAAVFHVRNCSRALRAMRQRRGSLDLDIPETEIIFHESGAVSELRFSARFEAHKVIEDCMIAANEAVAEYLTKKKVPLLYRVHEQADPERLEKLQPILRAFNIRLNVSKNGTIRPQDVQSAIKALGDRKGGHVLRRLILRSLKRAQYSPVNMGHFGLASKCYCHFTSPIRRYPDVVVHRQLKSLEAKEELAWPVTADGKADITSLGKHCSMREHRAQEAERDSTSIKAVEFIKQFEGDEFKGIISGIQGYGMFVELDPHAVEGLVSIASLQGDRYDIDELGIALVGRSSGHRFRLTDEVTVRIIKATPFEGQLDLELVDGGEAGGPTGKRKGYRPPPKSFLRKARNPANKKGKGEKKGKGKRR